MNDVKIETEDWRWHAVLNRMSDFEGSLFFAVRTTGVFCRPSCKARTPRRENVSFFETADAAEKGGFRACLKCKPNQTNAPDPTALILIAALRQIENADEETLTVASLGEAVGVSPGHLQKTFKRILGITPKQALDLFRLRAFKRRVTSSDVTTSLYESGFGSSRGLYERASDRLGMTPAIYKKGGKNMLIRYTIVDSDFGKMAVAATEKGLCSASFGENEKELLSELEKEFFTAEIVRADKYLSGPAKAILDGLAGERAILTLPLDIRATAFQMRVWAELRKIPYGETRSYKQVAENLGDPKAVRAVARACATNPVAIVTPCHRVIASDGKLSGYRWGIERKEQILERERSAPQSQGER